MNPFGAFSQKLEIRIGMDIQNIDQFGLQKCANVHPLFVDLLNSKDEIKINFSFLDFHNFTNLHFQNKT